MLRAGPRAWPPPGRTSTAPGSACANTTRQFLESPDLHEARLAVAEPWPLPLYSRTGGTSSTRG
jgi:hypothetical protein